MKDNIKKLCDELIKYNDKKCKLAMFDIVYHDLKRTKLEENELWEAAKYIASTLGVE